MLPNFESFDSVEFVVFEFGLKVALDMFFDLLI